MFKQIALLFALSIIIIFCLKELAYLFHFIIYWHNLVMHGLTRVFAGNNMGIILRNVSALVLLPLIIALVPAGIFRFVAHREFEYFSHCLWASWLILATILVLSK